MARAKLSFREQISGFPFGQILVICCARLSEPIAFSSLFPYVYFLTRDFHIAKTEADISKYAGYLSSVFAFSQVISSIQWSKFSQRNGRKLTIMIGLAGSMLSMLMLGFSTNYYMALAARSLMGLLNGNLPVLRTVIGEIAVERRHQALAFSTFPLLWNLGCIFGPLIGGSLVHPRQGDDYYRDRSIPQESDLFLPTLINNSLTKRVLGDDFQIKSTDFLTRIFPSLERLNESYPYALANIVVAILLAISIVILFLFMEETHWNLKYRYDFGLDLGDKIMIAIGVRDKGAKRPWQLAQENQFAQQHVQEDPFDYSDEEDDEEEEESEDLNSENINLLSETSSLDSNNDDQETFTPRSYGAINSGNNTNNNNNNNNNNALSRVNSGKTQRSQRSRRSGSSRKSVRDIGPFSRRQSITLVKTLSRSNEIKPLSSAAAADAAAAAEAEENDDTKIPWKALRDPMCYGPILANIILNIHAVCYDQFIPVFLSNDVIVNKNGELDSKFPFRISGGLGYTSEQVGQLLSLTGFLGIIIIIFIYPYVDRNYKSTTAFTNLHWLLIFVYVAYPFSVFSLPENFHTYLPDEQRSLAFTNCVLYVLSFCKVLATAMLYPLVTLLTHIGSPPKHRAIINSLAITAGAGAKCLAPIIFGSVMSFGISHKIGWLFFWSLGLAAIGGWFQSHQIVEDAEDEIHARHEDDVEGQR